MISFRRFRRFDPYRPLWARTYAHTHTLRPIRDQMPETPERSSEVDV